MSTSTDLPILRRIYVYALLASLLGRIPWWVVTNLTPAQRPRRSWTIRKVISCNMVRFLFSNIKRRDMELFGPLPNHLKLEQGKDIQGVYVDGVPHLLTGKLKEWAIKADAEPVRLPGYWIHKKNTSIIMGQKPLDSNEKVLLYLHGGAYVIGSAHPKQTMAGIPRGILKHAPSVKRAFSIEYRLASVDPYPQAGAFPSALIDALAGYSYLVNDVGFAPGQIVVIGDSAGGNLAQALTRYLVEYKDSLPGLLGVPSTLILLSPWCDMSGSHHSPTSSAFTNARSDYLASLSVTPHRVDAPPSFIQPFGIEFTKQTPYISPASLYLTDVSFVGFPRTFIAAGDAEVLLDQIRELARRMKSEDWVGEKGVVYYEAKDAFHDYYFVGSSEPERSETFRAIAQFLESPKA